MRLIDIISEEDIIPDLKASTKEGAIEEMVEYLVSMKKIAPKDKEKAIQEILEREKLGSTGIGNGLAIPHKKESQVTKKVIGVFARSSRGIDYGAIDGEKTHLFFLLFYPPASEEERSAHLAILKKLALLGRDSNFCRFLRESSTRQDIYELIEEIDEKITAQV